MMKRLQIQGWEEFPVPDSWQPFMASLSVAFDLSNGCGVNQQLFDKYATEQLTVAVEKLAVETYLHVYYSALPVARIAQIERNTRPELIGGPWQLAAADFVFPYELCWAVSRRGQNKPRRIEKPQNTELWNDTYCCHAYFVIERDFYGRAIRLIVGGVDSDDCINTWNEVVKWIRPRLKARSSNDL